MLISIFLEDGSLHLLDFSLLLCQQFFFSLVSVCGGGGRYVGVRMQWWSDSHSDTGDGGEKRGV